MRPALFIQNIIVIWLLLQTGSSTAQLYFKAKTLTTADGLADNRVTCFHKDKKGFMWIGTRNGLNRYDGHSFKIFRPSAGNSISNEVINDIAEDSKGRIWVATMEGLNIFDPVLGTWENLTPTSGAKGNSLPNFIIWDIWIDPNDRVWIASDVFDFCNYNRSTRKFTFYDWPAFARVHPEIKSTRYRSVQRFAVKNSHEYWLGTTKGLVLLNTESNSFSFIGGGYYSDVIDLKYDSATKRVFLSTEKGKLFVYKEETGVYSEVIAETEPYPSSVFTRPGSNEIWMASEKGLLKIGDNRNAIKLETNIPQLSGSLLPGGTRSVFKDDRNIRWIATANGISIYDPSVKSSAFLPLLAVSDKEGANRMGGAYYDSTSNCYFVCALDPSVVFIINARSGKINKITTDEKGNPFTLCTAIKRDNDNKLWLLTGTAVYWYDRSAGKFVLFPTPNNGKEIVFRTMLHDREGNYWFGSFNGGLYYFNSKEKRFTGLKDSSLFLFKSVTGLSSYDEDKSILVGTFGESIVTYNLLSGERKWYAETKEAADVSSLSLINDITKDTRGQIWIATSYGGIFRYNPGWPPEKTFTRFDMRQGLSNNNILSVCSDEDSALWLLSGKGVTAINLEGKLLYDIKEEQTFSFSSYASDSRYPHPVFFAPQKKELLVAVGGGLLIHSLERKDSLSHFPMLLTGVTINGTALPAEEINTASGHRLPFRSNAISFEFAGLYYGNSSGLVYEYKLDGYDNEWIDAGNSFTAAYQNLPPGNYLLYVRARDSNGHTSGEFSGFPFRIVPPFWRTWWFILLLFLLTLATVCWFIYSLLQKLKVERTVNSFATSLYGQNTTDDIFWNTAKNCIEKLGFTDCVIYQKDENRNVLIQKAAYGPKNPTRREILNVIEIPVGNGITGRVAQTGKPVIIGNTAKDPHYIIDDEKRLSEIAVPVIVDGKVFAVIDSEHRKKNFYSRYHMRILKKIAAICAERVTRHLTEERLRTKIARDMHDEMGSTLTSINIISKVAMEEKQEAEKTKQYFQKIKDHSARMMESMSDMVWAINPVNDNFEKVILRMKEFAAELLEPARINYYFTEEGSLEETQLNLEQRKDIYLIFKEAINNTVKYSGATEVNISFQQNGQRLRMMVTDNGNGFDATLENSGNGLKNMHSRSREMGATIKIESIKNTGTSIVLELPVT